MTEITLSILVHNPEKDWLLQMLQSCARQKNVLIDICDDSPQPCSWLEEACMADGEAAPWRSGPARYLRHSDNSQGLAGNWNFAVGNARTQWVSVLHQDDWLDDNYADCIRELMKFNSGAVAVFPYAQVVDSQGQSVWTLGDKVKEKLLSRIKDDPYLLEGDHGMAQLLKGNTIFCPAVCVNRKELGHSGFYPRWQMVVDLALWLELLADGKQLVGTKQVAYYYRRHDGALTSQYQNSLLRFKEELALYDATAAKAHSLGWKQSEKLARGKRILRQHMAVDLAKALVTLNFSRVKQLTGLILRGAAKG